jgi:hypothetical protein
MQCRTSACYASHIRAHNSGNAYVLPLIWDAHSRQASASPRTCSGGPEARPGTGTAGGCSLQCVAGLRDPHTHAAAAAQSHARQRHVSQEHHTKEQRVVRMGCESGPRTDAALCPYNILLAQNTAHEAEHFVAQTDGFLLTTESAKRRWGWVCVCGGGGGTSDNGHARRTKQAQPTGAHKCVGGVTDERGRRRAQGLSHLRQGA